jgi:VanZ family protein
MRLLKGVLPVVTLLMVAFIWGHSMMPGDSSSAESGFVFRLLTSVLGDGIITDHLVRKTAHFTEYMVLGMLCCANLAVYGRYSVGYVLAALYVCLFVAVADESIQLFTVGRNGALFDVWLDHCGSLTGVALCGGVRLYRAILNGKR